MLPDRVSNPGPLTYESGALPIALRGPARQQEIIETLWKSSMMDSLSRKLFIIYSSLGREQDIIESLQKPSMMDSLMQEAIYHL